MRNPSPKARDFIRSGIDKLHDPAALRTWAEWEKAHPFVRTEGLVNQAQERLPEKMAQTALAALVALTNDMSQTLDEARLPREQLIALENDLLFIQDVAGEIQQDLRERV